MTSYAIDIFVVFFERRALFFLYSSLAGLVTATLIELAMPVGSSAHLGLFTGWLDWIYPSLFFRSSVISVFCLVVYL
ncbi:hypothetical protein F5B22DRAFT_58005 [Xylaria bambusicola]|uniref:uncharacterized protein n=1 Tax=Xylaria bambusicola TaxID=326684 RepID=UPI0020082455|nr:uncharacterized protein F5B22DRAFT_58005 [Xylaria bambusicola]KAI0502772.1 hypothetical protein F5B22DRAFT_58005 [Xylaria bambusicola]